MRHLSPARLLAIVGFLCSGCDGPWVDGSEQALIGDPAPGFHFLPPIVRQAPDVTGTFDATLSPVVAIDQVDADGAPIARVATLSRSSGRGSERVRVAGDHYTASWHTHHYPLASGVYRVRVLVDERELGFADVAVMRDRSEMRYLDRNEYVPLVNGRTLPINFWIDGGVAPPPGGDGDGDGVADDVDVCPTVADPDQLDTDHNGIGDACECLEVACGTLDTCHEPGRCEPTTGECVDPVRADGTACDDGDPCTDGDACAAGTCTGSALACAPADACQQAGTCDPIAGCVQAPSPDGTPCDDGDPGNGAEACHAGVCMASVAAWSSGLDLDTTTAPRPRSR